jgi:thiol-disulfide isomerase/thioredoxin
MKSEAGKINFLAFFLNLKLMKKFLLIASVCLFLSNSVVYAQQYQIKAQLTGFADQTKFYLKDLIANVNVDSAVLVDGKFEMKGKNSVVKAFWLYTNVKPVVYTNLLIGPEQVLVKGDLKDFSMDLKITGSKHQDYFNVLNNQTKDLWKQRDIVVDSIMPYITGQKVDSTKKIAKRLGAKMNEIDSVVDGITLKFISENLNSYAAIRELYWKKNKYKKEEFERLFNAIKPEFKQSVFGKQIENYLKVGDALKKGDAYYDFEGADIKGKKHRISAYKGKYILLDFTETYCGPCILAADDLKKVAIKYPSELQIITFYAETNKKIMQEGLNRDQFNWPSIWDGKGNYSEITLKYGVQGYPTFVVINPEGKIVLKFSGYGKEDNGKGNIENEIDKLFKKSK